MTQEDIIFFISVTIQLLGAIITVLGMLQEYLKEKREKDKVAAIVERRNKYA